MSKVVPKNFNRSCHVLLKGLPVTATSGDLRRAVMLAGLQGVTDVSLVYKRFAPTGNGILTLSTPDLVRDAIRAAKKITFTGCEEITAAITADPNLSPERLRGVKGRADALNRGLGGFGASAGFPTGRTVTVTGFPGRSMTVQKFMPYLRGFQLANDETKSVTQAPLPLGVFSMFARFVVVLASESEAQRLVRKLHLTPVWNLMPTRYITAAVLY